jgi:two-component system sensor histidine kinase TctE
LLYDDIDRVFFSVHQGDRLIVGRPDIPVGSAHHSNEGDHQKVFVASLDQRPVRVARLDILGDGREGVMILVAETMVKRDQTRQDLELVLWPMVALVIAAAAAILSAVRRTLRPLEQIAARWNERSHQSLQPIRGDDVPRELLPFASALNDLLGRIRAILARERQFALTAAHQLRTPLAGLQLGLRRATEALDPGETRDLVLELKQTTQRMARLVQQLLAIGRLDPEASRDLDFEMCNLVPMVQEIGAAHYDQALGKGVDLEMTPSAADLWVRLQPELFAEALGNILDNAIRYTPRGGRILIEFAEHPVRILVSDSGPGISEDERELVFERFTRGRSAMGEGSGLGLAIVREIATLHGATVALNVSKLGGVAAILSFPH